MRKIPVFRKTNNKPMTIGIFLSGSGTNFDAIVRYIKDKNIIDANIEFVFSNVPNCPGIKNAKNQGFTTFSLSSRDFFAKLGKQPDDVESRKDYDMKVLNTLSDFIETDLIVLAGYRRKLSHTFYSTFNNRIINMYPGDITKDYLITGIPASLQALQNKDKEIKCTVYFDREDVRFGTAILQSKPIELDGYKESNISELDSDIREKAEWTALPFTMIEVIAKQRLSFDEGGQLYLDDLPLPENGFQL